MIPRAAHDFFSPEEQNQIRAAVARAEGQSSGEVVPVIIDQASSYSRTTARSAFMLTMALTALTLWLIPDVGSAHLFWQLPLGSIISFAIFCFIIEQIPALKRSLLPQSEIDVAMQTRSFENFARHGVYKTKARNGILILICLLEHRVEILADEGINAKIDATEWQKVADEIAAGLKQGTACASLCSAINHCGELLATHFPHSAASAAADINELPDLIIPLRS
ncbi:MAG: TPM domain-containing protein [Desulfuromonadaceae bacterium]|jgi:putative membrane protein|nr:TPM domain-containing protein [Desulfuromonas sp.]MDY0184321.1 TPM domain-containing protein [Desulfuromonadaceae bacterium]